MPIYLQADRFLTVTTPLGPDVLLLQGMTGTEAISSLFAFELDLLAESGTPVAFDRLLGQKVVVAMDLPGRKSRYFAGICSRLAQGPRDSTFDTYTMEIVPQVWLLTRKAQSRIFQQMSVPDILKKVFDGLDVSYQIQGTFEPRDYCVQYRETDFAFASRLMEEEGLFYFFKHSASGHTMIVANTPQGHPELPERSAIEYELSEVGDREADRITKWEKVQELRSGKVTLWDHCFELPGKHLDADKTVQDSVSVGNVTHKLKVASNDKLELYDYPGLYAQRFDGVNPAGGDRPDDLQKIFQDNARTVGLRMQEEASQGLTIRGESVCRYLASGHKFTLERHFDADAAYVITRVSHEARIANAYRSDGPVDSAYKNTFTCIPAALPYRPQRDTPRPVVHGTQTAVVVGPSSEEIFTDKYGRVKVQFPWDRQGKNDADSSCWVRVGTPWAGKNWGMIHIPRVGQEVIVGFEEGDPDRPIIVGSVYNADMMPPYKLPDNKTQSGVKTRSTLKGSPDTFNELRFEDKKGSEQVYFHAEKNFDRVVENNDTLRVGFEKKGSGDQTVEIFNNQTIKVGGPSCSDGSQSLTVHKNRSVVVSTGDDSHEIKAGNRGVVIDMGNDALTIKMGNQTTKLNLGKSETEAMQSIELKVGQSSIKIDQMGVTITGMMVKVEGQVSTEVKSLMTKVSGDAMLQMRGGLTMIN